MGHGGKAIVGHIWTQKQVLSDGLDGTFLVFLVITTRYAFLDRYPYNITVVC
jgi:hypothetical protein